MLTPAEHGSDGATVSRGEQQRLSIKAGEPLFASLDGRSFESARPITFAELAELETVGLPLGELMVEHIAASSSGSDGTSESPCLALASGSTRSRESLTR